MRFKATLTDIGSIQSVSKVVGTVAKLSKTCVLRLTTSKMLFILTESQLHGGSTLWCDLPQSNFCSAYDFGGHGERNEIFMEVPVDIFAHTLKSAQQAKVLRVKLTQKKTPCLTVDISLASISSNSRSIVHDIPVKIIPSRLWDEYKEPSIPDYDVSIYMPPLKILRNVVDRLKNLSSTLSVSANNNGEMMLKVRSEIVSISISFKDLVQVTWHAGPSQSQKSLNESSQLADKKQFFEVKIDIRHLHQMLNGLQLNTEKVICNLLEKEAVQLFFMHDEVSLQYTIPAYNLVG